MGELEQRRKCLRSALRLTGVTMQCCKGAPCGDCPLVSPVLAGAPPILLSPRTCQRDPRISTGAKTDSRKEIFIFKAPLIPSLIRRGDKPFTQGFTKWLFFASQATCSHCGSHKAEPTSLGALKKNGICCFFGYCCYLSLPLLLRS